MHTPSPTIEFHVQSRSGEMASASRLLDDIDLLFRLAFVEVNFNSCGGLLISADGKAWNSPAQFDTDENIVCWFEAAGVLAGAPTDPVEVWAWEESDCEMVPSKGEVVLKDARARLKQISFRRVDLLHAFLAAGHEIQALQDRIHWRLAEILSVPGEQSLPAEACRWVREIPSQYLTEINSPLSSSPFVFVEGMDPLSRWDRVLETCMPAELRLRLAKALETIGEMVA